MNYYFLIDQRVYNDIFAEKTIFKFYKQQIQQNTFNFS